uniref:methyltransferase n=1 Tax=uncultured Aeromicrobium sp. TaxID=337820 RepID=UPI0025FFA01C
ALGTDELATRALLDALTAMDLLTCDGQRYRATELGARLGHDGDLRLIAEKEAFFARHWLDLAESVRTGRPRLAPWAERLETDPEQARFFLRALVVLARETGPDLTGIAGFGAGNRVVDLGGGLGAYSAQLAAAGAQVTLVDLPRVVAWAETELADLAPRARDRITLVPTDLFAASAVTDIGTGHDGVLISHLLHDLDDADSVAALRRAAELVRPGGTVVVFELPGDPAGTFGPLFDLMMRVETPGRARRLEELTDLMHRAGLTDVRVSDSHRLPHGVLTARG